MIVSPLPAILPGGCVLLPVNPAGTMLANPIVDDGGCIIPPAVTPTTPITIQLPAPDASIQQTSLGEHNCWDPRTWGAVKGATDGSTIQLPPPSSPIQ